MAGKIAVEIRYFTSGITWKADYVGIANETKPKLRLTGYVRVANNSGELYDNAQTRPARGRHDQPGREDRRPWPRRPPRRATASDPKKLPAAARSRTC